jgi:NAD-dependent SIR2 family protein deacetylase
MSLFPRSIGVFLILILNTFASIPVKGDSPSGYFSDPKLFSTEELAQELNQKMVDMCWQFGQDSHFRFISGNDEVYFEIQLGALPDIYDGFVTRVMHKFTKKEAEKQLIFSYKIKSDGSEAFNLPQGSPNREHAEEYSYLVADRRIIENANPQRICPSELATIIKDKNVLFYTGAGLSLASNIPAMNELYELLGLKEGKDFLFLLENALDNPRTFASKIQLFHNACLFSPPTQAHLALKDLAVFKKVRIITENLDALHEASGIYPYRIDPDHLRSEVDGSALLQFEYIICIGLSYDDRGFLGWYKQQNPQGKIIALDLKQPSYLGDEDFLVVGDIQEIIPVVQKIISSIQSESR